MDLECVEESIVSLLIQSLGQYVEQFLGHLGLVAATSSSRVDAVELGECQRVVDEHLDDNRTDWQSRCQLFTVLRQAFHVLRYCK